MSSFTNILSRMLARVSSTRDKRQGSVIYDTLSPTAAELAQMNIVISIFREQTYLLTATGGNLENWAANFLIARRPATNAIRIAEMLDTDGAPIDLPVGSRFSAPNTSGLNFILTENTDTAGECLLMCETVGTIGNGYLGPLLPLFVINNLGAATIVGTYNPAEDTETDDALRERVLARLNQKTYGGNVADYKEFTTAISGVGAVKVFPVWADGRHVPTYVEPPADMANFLTSIAGTSYTDSLEWVKTMVGFAEEGYLTLTGGRIILSIVDSEYNIATDEFIEVVQNEIDPVGSTAEGLGLAPIGHRVSVVTPTEIGINISATLALKAGYTVPQLQESIESTLEAYILSLRKDWADAVVLNVFVSRINAAILSVVGVDNVTDVKINDSPDDLVLVQTVELQQLPVFSGVVLNV